MTAKDRYDIVNKHVRDLRRALVPNPTTETLAAWEIEDMRHRMAFEYENRFEEQGRETGV